MSFTVGKHSAPTLIIIALVIIVVTLAYLVTTKSHSYSPNVAHIELQN
jgi:hypothetical protein